MTGRARWPWIARWQRIGVVAVAVALVAACSSGSDSVAENDDTATPGDSAPVDSAPSEAEAQSEQLPGSGAGFDDAMLAEADAEPFARLAIDGLVEATGVFALFELADGASWATPVSVDADGPYVIVPPSPSDPYGGGKFELRLTDGVDVGAGLTVTVSPLRESDVTFDDLIASKRSEIDAAAALLGSSWDELAAEPPERVRRDLLPLKIAQVLLDDGTGDSVVGLVASLDESSVQLLGDMLAAAGFAEPLGVGALADQIASAEAELGGAVISGFAGPIHRSAPAAPRVSPLPSGGADCIPANVEPNISASRLSEMMTKSALGAIASNTDTLAGKYLAGAEMAIGLSAALETAATGGSTNVAATVGTFVTAEKMLQSLNAGMMPSVFTNIDVTLDPDELEEDREEPGEWTEVWVTAMSTGYSLDGDLAGIAIDQVGGAIVGKAGIEQGSLLEHEANAAVGEVKGTVTGMLPQEGTITFCPSTWRVDIAGEEWSWARPLNGILTVDNKALTYVNEKEVADETLRFAPLPEKFGGRTIAGDIQVSTEAIDVKVTASKTEITSPGEVVQITAEIDHAVVETLAWSPGDGRWDDGVGADTNGPRTRPLATPTDPSKYPVRVEVESTSRQGLRANAGADDRRYDFIEIELAPIVIMPNPGSVEVGKTLQFTATDRDGNPVDVVWTATGGTIGRDTGLYTAGDETGEFQVTATLRENSAVSATVPVNVGEFCLTGTWRINQQAFTSLIAQGGVDIRPAGGTWDLTVRSDGSFSSVLTAFAFEISEGGVTVKVTINGSQTGSVSYTATDITAVTTDSINLSMIGELNGQTIPMSPSDLEVGTEFGGGPYRCEDGQLIVNRDGYDILYDKVG